MKTWPTSLQGKPMASYRAGFKHKKFAALILSKNPF